MSDRVQLDGTKSLATGTADGQKAGRPGPGVPARAWRNSLLGKTTSIFLIGVVFAYALGALVGWQMFTTAALEQWRNQARMNTQIASATLRNIYTYIAVDV
ncbi:MAG: hypothetical protein ACK4G5_05875, partial [Devosia sp.]